MTIQQVQSSLTLLKRRMRTRVTSAIPQSSKPLRAPQSPPRAIPAPAFKQPHVPQVQLAHSGPCLRRSGCTCPDCLNASSGNFVDVAYSAACPPVVQRIKIAKKKKKKIAVRAVAPSLQKIRRGDGSRISCAQP